jgi:PAS domain S-box-containing protein
MSEKNIIEKEGEKSLQDEILELRSRLQEAEEILEAIRTGGVDALTIQGPDGPQVFTLKGADHTYRILIEEMNEGAVTLNKEATILYANAAFADFINFPLEQVIGSSFYNFLSLDYRSYFKTLSEQGWQGKSKGEFVLQRPDGKVLPFSISMNALNTGDAIVLGMIVTDLSAEKEIRTIKSEVIEKNKLLVKKEEELRQEKLIRESIERMRFLAEAMPEKVWTAKPDGNVNYYNRKWLEYTGMSFEELKDWGWKYIVHPDDLEKNEKVWQLSIATGKDFELEHRFLRADGTYRWHLSRGIAQRNEKGEIIMWVGTNTDIQNQKEYTERLAQIKQNLDVMNIELTDKNKQLIRTNIDLDNFIYTASHDLKAPVLNIEGLINTLVSILQEEGLMKKEIEPVINMMSNSVARFKETISDLTEITKIQKDLAEDITSLNCYEIIEDVKDSIRDLIAEADAAVHVDTAKCPEINFSKKNLKSIIYNLLSNAIKYRSPERKPEIFIITERVEDYCMLTVKDNGLGMKLDNKSKIFSMFKRLHDHVEGTGVGLYIVKRIVDNAGGKIEVESEVGKGSTFKVYFKA